jgi:bacterioferritin
MGAQPTEGKVIELLNQVLSLEYSAVIQYNQHRFLLTGKDRVVYADFFTDASKEAHSHVTRLGDKIVALGGVPTVEPGVIRQATSLQEMLKLDLEMEKEAVAAYLKTWEAAEGNRPLRFWLEAIISDEQLHVDQLEKLAAEQEIRSDRVNREIRFRGVS